MTLSVAIRTYNIDTRREEYPYNFRLLSYLSAKNLNWRSIYLAHLFGGKSVINQDMPGCNIVWISVPINPGEIVIRYGYFQKHISKFCFLRLLFCNLQLYKTLKLPKDQ